MTTSVAMCVVASVKKVTTSVAMCGCGWSEVSGQPL